MTELVLPNRDPDAMELYRQAGLIGLHYGQVTADEVLARFEEPVLICGHSHIPWKQEQGGRLIVNPGSVGVPINGDTRAQYALLTWEDGRWRAEHRAIDYDRDRIRAAYHESGILAVEGAFARAMLRGIETGQNVPGRLVSHCRRCAAEEGIPGSEAIPDAIWDQATATFDWDAAVRGESKHGEKSILREGKIA